MGDCSCAHIGLKAALKQQRRLNLKLQMFCSFCNPICFDIYMKWKAGLVNVT